jgi:hypothetical protein
MAHPHFFEEGIKKIRDSREGRRRIEIAIKAFAKTKRNVNVEAGSL